MHKSNAVPVMKGTNQCLKDIGQDEERVMFEKIVEFLVMLIVILTFLLVYIFL